MRLLVVLAAILVGSPAVTADELLDAQRSAAIARARELKGTGMTLAGLGAVAFATSAAIGIASQAGASFGCDRSSIQFCSSQVVAGLAIAVTAGIGVLATASGVPMWAVGAKRVRRLEPPAPR